MAVSGRKIDDYQGSMSLTSEEFDHMCDPCKTTNQHIKARGYCEDCCEYLCQSCFTSHKKTKASKHHHLLDNDTIGQKPASGQDSGQYQPIERCPIHQGEMIKFFCPKHEELGCHDCIILHHRSCDIDYIPDKCANIDTSDEYRELMKNLDDALKENDAVIKRASGIDQKIDTCHDNILKELTRFRKEINERLDQMQNKIKIEADERKTADKQNVKKVIATCAMISSDIRKFQSILESSKALNGKDHLYIAVKQTKAVLKKEEIKNVAKALSKTDLQYRFKRSKDLEDMLTRQNILGELTVHATLMHMKLTLQKNIQIRTEADAHSCCITGCAVLSPNKLVLVDNHNKKLKVLDTESNIVVDEKQLVSKPYDVAILPNEQLAVTIPDNGKIRIMKASGKLSDGHVIKVRGRCRGITYKQDTQYVICGNPSNVFMMDIRGIICKTLSLNNETLQVPVGIDVSEDSRLILISDYTDNSVLQVTQQGGKSVVQKKDINEPLGLLLLEDGSVLVCCYNDGVHHIYSADMKEIQKKIGDVSHSHAICYDEDQHMVYIGGRSDQLEVYRLE